MPMQDFEGLVKSLNPALARCLLTGDVRTLDSYNRATTITGGTAGIGLQWRRDKKGFHLGQGKGLTAGGGSLSIADAAELRCLRGTLFWTCREMSVGAADAHAIIGKRDAGGTCFSLAVNNNPNQLAIYDGTNIRTMTATALTGSRTGAVRYVSGGTPQLFVDGAYRVDASGTIVPPNDDAPLYLANLYTLASGSKRTDYGFFGIFNDAILGRAITDQEIAQLHDAWESIISIHRPKRTISLPRKATEIVSTPPLLHLAGERNSAGLLLDLSGNGRNGTISGRVTQTKGPSGAKQQGHGAGNPLIAAAADTSVYPNSFTLELRYVARSQGESNQGCLWSVSDGGTTRSRLFLGAANVWWYEVAYAGSTARWTFAAGPYNLPHEITIKHARSLGTAPTVTLDGETLVVTEAVAASGALTAATAPIVNRLNTAALDSDFDGDLIDDKQWGSLLTDAECRALYLDHALSDVRRLANRTDHPVSVANVTGVGRAGPWNWVNGSINWDDDGTRRRIKAASAAGYAWAASQGQAYGAVYWRAKKVADADVLWFTPFMAGHNVSHGNTGYAFRINSDEGLYLYRWTGAAWAATVLSTAAGYVANNVEYEFLLTRRPRDGYCVLWICGGAFTAWTAAATGTDNTHVSGFDSINFGGDTGGYIADVTFIPGGHSLLPTEVPWLAAA